MVITNVIEAIKTIGALLSAIIVIAGALGSCSKKVRAHFSEKVRSISGIDALKKDVETIATNLQDYNSRFTSAENRISENESLMVAMLRDIITRVYHQNYQTKTLPPYGKQYICHMYEDYRKRGGNSYVKQIYEEMMEWEER